MYPSIHCTIGVTEDCWCYPVISINIGQRQEIQLGHDTSPHTPFTVTLTHWNKLWSPGDLDVHVFGLWKKTHSFKGRTVMENTQLSWEAVKQW